LRVFEAKLLICEGQDINIMVLPKLWVTDSVEIFVDIRGFFVYNCSVAIINTIIKVL